MSYVQEAMGALIQGVRDGRKDSLGEAPYFKGTLGLYPDINALRNTPIEVGHLPAGVLGATNITSEGKVVGMRISRYIADMGLYFARKYNKSLDWAKSLIYGITRDTTNHEDYHIMSAKLAKGEEITEDARDLMESVTTRGRYKVKLEAGKQRAAEIVKRTNPYPRAWKIAEIADWAPYEGPSGTGHKGMLGDASIEPFYKPFGRLALASAKAAIRKGRSYFGGTAVPSYVPQAA